MTRNEIITALAREQRVEQIVSNICPSMSPELRSDLCQDVYVALCRTEEERIQDLWEHDNQINYYIVRIIKNNLSITGKFNMSQLRWENKRTRLTAKQYEEGETI